MRKLVFLGMLLLARPVFADECRLVEYEDHFEAICVGDPLKKPETADPSETQAPRSRWQVAERSAAPEQASQPNQPPQEETLSYVHTYLRVPGGRVIVPASTQVPQNAAPPGDGSREETAPTASGAPRSGLLQTRRGPYWVESNGSGGYLATPAKSPPGG